MESVGMDDTMVTFDTHEEAERFVKLVNQIVIAVEQTDFTYQEVMQAMDAVNRSYEKKGRDLLNDKSIKEVACYKALLD